MKLISAICWLSMALLGQAFVKPAGLPDGVYSVDIDSKGNAIGEPVLLLLANKTDSSAQLDARQADLPPSHTYCNTQSGFHGADYINSWSLFNSYCDTAPYAQPSQALAVWYGDAISYMCNYGSGPARCWRKEFNQANDRFNAQCGKGKPSWTVIDAYHKSYGRDSVTWPIC